MTCVGDGGELGKDARVPGADLIELDVRDGLQAPVQTCPLSVGQCRGELLELGRVEEEETGAKAVDSRTMFSIGGVGDWDVVEDGEASAGCLELGSDDLEEIGNLQALEVEGTGRGRRGNGSESGGSLRGGNVGGERGAGETLFERTALLSSASTSTSRVRAVISCTLRTERIWPGILSSMLWHWSSMNTTPESGASPPPPTTSCMIRNSWNGSAEPTMRSSSA